MAFQSHHISQPDPPMSPILPVPQPPLKQLALFFITDHAPELSEIFHSRDHKLVVAELSPNWWLRVSTNVPDESILWWRFEISQQNLSFGVEDKDTLNKVERLIEKMDGRLITVFFDAAFDIPQEKLPARSFMKLFADIETTVDGIGAILRGAKFSLRDKILREVKWQYVADRDGGEGHLDVELEGVLEMVVSPDVFKDVYQQATLGIDRILGTRKTGEANP